MAEPVRRGMEMKLVRDGEWRPAALGGNAGGSVHEDILALGGRETEVTWEDVFHSTFILLFLFRFWFWSGLFFSLSRPSVYLFSLLSNLKCVFVSMMTDPFDSAGDELREPPSFHDEMEQRLKISR